MKRNLCFTTTRGEILAGELLFPKKMVKKNPLVIFCHGFIASKKMLFYPFLAKRLLAAGWAVYRFDLPGHGKSTGSKYEMTLPRMQTEIPRLIDLLSKQVEVDVNKIVMIGHSFGGILSMMVAETEPRLRAVVAIGAALNYGQVLKHLLKIDKIFLRGKYFYFRRHFPLMPAQRLHISLQTYIDNFNFAEHVAKIKIPVLLVHGSNDQTIPLALAQETKKSLSGSTKLVEVPGAGHLFWKKGEREIIAGETINWLQKYA